MTSLEKELMKMSPEKRKRAVAEISAQMGMPPKKPSAGIKKRSGGKKK